jgi:hypothetical protein
VSQEIDHQREQTRRPQSLAIRLTVRCERPVDFDLSLRLPWWLQGTATITLNGEHHQVSGAPSSWHRLLRTWHDDTLTITFPKGLTSVPLPDDPTTMAFMDGPVVLAGLCDEERTLLGDARNPSTLLKPDNEREWGNWEPGYRTRNQERNIRFVPLHDVRDERYTVYFPVTETV